MSIAEAKGCMPNWDPNRAGCPPCKKTLKSNNELCSLVKENITSEAEIKNRLNITVNKL